MTLALLLPVIAIAIGLAAFDLYAQGVADGKGPFDLSLLGTYGWIVAVSLLGGLASFYQKVRRGQARWVNVNELLGELMTSALAGLLTYWLCRSAGVNEWLTAAFVGIGGHMGSRALFVAERLMERWLDRFSVGSVQMPSTEHRKGAPGDEHV